MVYAADILSESFEKTKNLFFPIRPGYWIRMGFISLFGSSFGGGSGGNSGYNSSGRDLPSGLNFTEAISQFNTGALDFLSKYGTIVAIVFIMFYAISIFFTYINSVFRFMFIEGIVKKDVRIIKSFKDNKSNGLSLFFLRFIFGLISLAIFLLVFSPMIIAFFSNTLVTFNFWLLIPMFLLLLLFALIVGIFWFLVYDFVVPIMYLKQLAFSPAWHYFIKIARNNKLEIFLYWLIRIGLAIASAVISLIVILPMLLVLGILVLIGVLIYFTMNALFGATAALIITVILGSFLFIFWIFAMVVVFVPIPAFFRMYSIEIVKKLDSVKK